MKFNYKFEAKKEYVVLILKGSLLSVLEAKDLLNTVNNELKEQKNFIVDLGEIIHISSEGLNVLLNILTKSRNSGGETILCNLSTHIQSLFIITKLNNIFTILNNRKLAVEKLTKS